MKLRFLWVKTSPSPCSSWMFLPSLRFEESDPTPPQPPAALWSELLNLTNSWDWIFALTAFQMIPEEQFHFGMGGLVTGVLSVVRLYDHLFWSNFLLWENHLLSEWNRQEGWEVDRSAVMETPQLQKVNVDGWGGHVTQRRNTVKCEWKSSETKTESEDHLRDLTERQTK